MSTKQVTLNSVVVPIVAPFTPTLNENESERQIFVSIETHLTNIVEINLSAMVYEVNLVQNTNEWWVDTGATRHICSDKKLFSTYQCVEYGDNFSWETPRLLKLKERER